MIFLISCLSVWRICHLLSVEDGPLEVVVKIRKRLGSGQLGRLIDCVGCSSVWVSFPVSVIAFSDHWFLYWLSISAVTILLEGFYELLRRKT